MGWPANLDSARVRLDQGMYGLGQLPSIKLSPFGKVYSWSRRKEVGNAQRAPGLRSNLVIAPGDGRWSEIPHYSPVLVAPRVKNQICQPDSSE